MFILKINILFNFYFQAINVLLIYKLYFKMADLNTKYQKLATEYAKLR